MSIVAERGLGVGREPAEVAGQAMVARVRCGGRASGRPVHRAGNEGSVCLVAVQHKPIRAVTVIDTAQRGTGDRPGVFSPSMARSRLMLDLGPNRVESCGVPVLFGARADSCEGCVMTDSRSSLRDGNNGQRLFPLAFRSVGPRLRR